MNFFDQPLPLSQRMVGRHEDGDLLVSTVRVFDTSMPYETAVLHPQYNEGALVIVQTYDSREHAEEGHAHWIKVMTTDPIPDSLQDKSLFWACELQDIIKGTDHRKKEKSS